LQCIEKLKKSSSRRWCSASGTSTTARQVNNANRVMISVNSICQVMNAQTAVKVVRHCYICWCSYRL